MDKKKELTVTVQNIGVKLRNMDACFLCVMGGSALTREYAFTCMVSFSSIQISSSIDWMIENINPKLDPIPSDWVIVFSSGNLLDDEWAARAIVERVTPKEGNIVHEVFKEFVPISKALTEHKLKTGEGKNLKELSENPDKSMVNTAFGNILTKILEGAGYVVTVEILKPKYFNFPTIDRVAQRIHTGNKRGNFLVGLMDIGRKSEDPLSDRLIYDENEAHVIGFKIDVDIPSAKAVKGHIQLAIDFDFQQEAGFKIIPIKEMETKETKDKLNRMLQEAEQKISKELDPLTLRIKDAIICLSQDKGSRKFDYTENELLDLLHGKKGPGSGRGYHDTRDKKRLRSRIQLISNIKLTYAVKIGNQIIGIEDIPHIILNPEGKPFIEYIGTAGKAKKRYNFQSIEIPERYYDLFYGNFAGQLDREAILLTGSKYSLCKYIAAWWRSRWEKDHGVYEWYLSDILRGAGIALPTRGHESRFIKNLEADLDDIKNKKLMKGYKRIKRSNPLSDKWRFEATAELKERYKNMGKGYKEAQELRRLKAQKKKLELKDDIIELEKTEDKK